MFPSVNVKIEKEREGSVELFRFPTGNECNVKASCQLSSEERDKLLKKAHNKINLKDLTKTGNYIMIGTVTIDGEEMNFSPSNNLEEEYIL